LLNHQRAANFDHADDEQEEDRGNDGKLDGGSAAAIGESFAGSQAAARASRQARMRIAPS
jgi:hypothetical protein